MNNFLKNLSYIMVHAHEWLKLFIMGSTAYKNNIFKRQ